MLWVEPAWGGEQSDVQSRIWDLIRRPRKRRADGQICELVGGGQHNSVVFLLDDSTRASRGDEPRLGPIFLSESSDFSLEPDLGFGSVDHAREDAPVATLNRDGAFGSHADHCFQPVDQTQVLPVVDASRRLDKVRCEPARDAILLQILCTSLRRSLEQARVLDNSRERRKREQRRLVHSKEFPNRTLHQPLRADRRQRSILPQQLCKTPPITNFALRAWLAEDELGAVVDAERVDVVVARTRVGSARDFEAELLGGIDEVVVDGDEDGGAELDGLGGVVEGVHGGGAATNVGFSVEDGDVDGVGGGVAAEVVGG